MLGGGQLTVLRYLLSWRSRGPTNVGDGFELAGS